MLLDLEPQGMVESEMEGSVIEIAFTFYGKSSMSKTTITGTADPR